jgi:hypothetical protein
LIYTVAYNEARKRNLLLDISSSEAIEFWGSYPSLILWKEFKWTMKLLII